MRVLRWIARSIFGLLGIALGLLLVPFVFALLLYPFWGSLPLAFVAVNYASFLNQPFYARGELGDHVDFRSMIEQNSAFECYHLMVGLDPMAQPQPFAILDRDKDWQPQLSGGPEDQPRGDRAWKRTPLPESQVESILFDMKDCGLSEDRVQDARNALLLPGSWIAFGTRGADKVLIYSKRLNFALVFSNET